MAEQTARSKRTPGTDLETIKILVRSGEGKRALQRLGDRWSFLVLRDVFLGVHRFDELRRLSGAARGTLSTRLNALVEQGILYRNHYGNSVSRVEYRLTDKGLAFYPVALCMWEWASRWGAKSALPPRLVHTRCSHEFHPVLVCSHCQQPLDMADVTFEAGPRARLYAASRSTTRRRVGNSDSVATPADSTMIHMIDVLGDRWTALLVSALLFFGLRHYHDINKALGISTNILANRLRNLIAAGVLEHHESNELPRRYEYRLTDKGKSIFPVIVALHDWARHWMPSPHGPGLILKHRTCRRPLRSMVVCSECHAPVDRREVRLGRAASWTAAREATARGTASPRGARTKRSPSAT